MVHHALLTIARDLAAAIPIAEYYRRIFAEAMGWLGWTPAEAGGADVNSAIIAIAAKAELLSQIHGDGKPKPDKVKGVAKALDAFKQRQRRNPPPVRSKA